MSDGVTLGYVSGNVTEEKSFLSTNGALTVIFESDYSQQHQGYEGYFVIASEYNSCFAIKSFSTPLRMHALRFRSKLPPVSLCFLSLFLDESVLTSTAASTTATVPTTTEGNTLNISSLCRRGQIVLILFLRFVCNRHNNCRSYYSS